MAKPSLDAVMAAVESDDYVGFCLACGVEADNCEPDMEHGICRACDLPQVFGAEQILIMGAYDDSGDE